jgi:glycosyltransferase involved in cell wall biosynthesis
MIEICIVCYNFQRRWTMQLASLVQQIDAPDFIINVAYVKGNGDPDVETIVKYYENKGLKFKLTPYTDLNSRGLIRNVQVKNSSEDWLLFVDCDVVYHPNFFKELSKNMDPNCQNVIGCPKFMYTNVEMVNEFFNKFESMYVENSYKIAETFDPIKPRIRRVASGGMQLVRRQLVMEKAGGRYVNPRRTGDNTLGHVGTRSDIKFRSAIDGGRKNSILLMKLPYQIHLEHYRSVDEQFDNESQR